MDSPGNTIPGDQQSRKPVLYVLVLFIVLGVGLVITGWLVLQHTRQFIAHAVPTTGRLIGYAEDTSDEGTMFKPVVQFTTADGRQITYRSQTGASFQTRSIGSEVRLRYDPANPQRASIDSFLEMWFVPAILFFIGAFFIGIPATILIVTRGRL